MLVRKGLVESRQKAQALIMAGLVFSEGKRIEKPGQGISEEKEISLKEQMPFVSRGGLKLSEALDQFELSVEGKTAADLGASTGGFTDCLLQRGAKKVYAVDVDIRQLDWRLRQNPKVVCLKKNARYLQREDFDETLDIITTDLSFISICKVLPAVKEFIGEGQLLSLLKPQFEVERHLVGKKGIVRDPHLHEQVLEKIVREVCSMDFKLKALIKSSTPGAKGNREFFAHWTKRGKSYSFEKLQRLIKEVVWDAKN